MESNKDNDGPKHISHYLSQALEAIWLRAEARSDVSVETKEAAPAAVADTPKLNLVGPTHQEDEQT